MEFGPSAIAAAMSLSERFFPSNESAFGVTATRGNLSAPEFDCQLAVFAELGAACGPTRHN